MQDCPIEAESESLSAVAEHIAEVADSEVDIIFASYEWVVHSVAPPPDGNMWSVDHPLFRQDHLSAIDAAVPPGAWAERVTALLQMLIDEFASLTIEAHRVHGFIKPLGSVPGTSWTLPNHCWLAVGASHAWFLLDPAWAAVPGTGLAFFTAPEHFIYTHCPLLERWQLLASPVTLAAFWGLPQLAPAFFSRGLEMPTIAPAVTETGTVSVSIRVPAGIMVRPHLLDLPDLNEVSPHPDGTRGVPPGAYVFAHRKLAAGESGAGTATVDWEVFARLPEPGRDFCIRLVAWEAGERPEVEVMMMKVTPGPSARDVGRVLPNTHAQWIRAMCSLIHPPPTAALRAGEPVRVRVRVPKATGEVAVGIPGGYAFTLLEREGENDEFVGEVTPTPDAESLAVTTYSDENPGIFLPLLTWDLRETIRSPFRSLSASPEGKRR